MIILQLNLSATHNILQMIWVNFLKYPGSAAILDIFVIVYSSKTFNFMFKVLFYKYNL